MFSFQRLLPLALSLCLGACAHYPVNARLAPADPHAGYRFDNFPPTAENSDDLFVVLALSGGGARAGAFSYGILEELRRTPITRNGQRETLLDEVDVISPASAAAFTAAYYALRHDDTFDSFPKRFFRHDVQADVIGAIANPLNWPRLASPTFDRVDLAAEQYDRDLFDGRTFGDLLQAHRRPYLLMAAADVSLGHQFEFTQEQFDCLNSDLASVPVARAVAAAAAYPVAMSPVTFDNHPRGEGYREPAWIAEALADEAAPASLRSRAADLRSYANVAAHPHVRLLDGAIADYSGLRAPLLSFTSARGDFSIRRMIDAGKIKRLVVISINAVKVPDNFDRSDAAPGWFDMLYMTASAPIRNGAFETIARFREALQADREAIANQRGYVELLRKTDPQAAAAVKLPPAYDSNFVAVDFSSVKDAALRARLENIDTTLSLKPAEIADLRRAATEALRDSAEFQSLVRGLNGDQRQSAVVP